MRLPRPVVRAVARAKPLVPAYAWPVLHTVRSLVGDRPILATPSFRRVLVLTAHPDDEVPGCGGLIALLAAAGATVTVLAATDGEATLGAATDAAETGRRRRAELEASCRMLGASARSLGYPDGQVAQHAAALARDIAGAVAELDPEALLLPWAGDGHPDHVAVCRAAQAADLPPELELWGYDTWNPLPPNRVVDVTSVFPLKEKALAAHVTALQAFDVSALLALDRYRSAAATSGHGHVEGYLVAPASQWFDLVPDQS